MVKIKGKFIILVASLMKIYKKEFEKTDNELYDELGLHWNELGSEEWYDIKYYNLFIKSYVKASPTNENAMVTLGRKIYPTIKATTGFPPNLVTPLDFIKYESQGYTENIKGPDIVPRTFVREDDGDVIIQMNMKEQPCKLMEGVYKGILDMSGASFGQVFHDKCILKGDPYCEFHITW